MTVRTKRRVLVCLVVLAVTLPVELVLLQALAAPSEKEAITQWVASLSPEDLETASQDIQFYPVRYRKGIMRALTPAQRSFVWRAHIVAYLLAHPELDEATQLTLGAAIVAASPDALSNPTTESRERIRAVAEQLVVLIGRDQTNFLLYRLGPSDGMSASIEPLSHKVAGFVRGLATAFAEEGGCDCSTEWGCDIGARCDGTLSCTVDNDWPACGWLWSDPCNGLCRSGIEG
jgi:hypothetical protein